MQPLKNKYPAFTLAEVLITLGVIGIIAAMTIPNLIASYQKKVFVNRLKQTTSLLSQGLKLYMAEEDISDLTGDLDWKTDKEAFNTLFKKYFKVARDCNGKYAPCFSSLYTSLSGKDKVGTSGSTCNVIFVLMNGVALCADAIETPSYEDENGNTITSSFKGEALMAIELDVNGSAPPNRYGVDYFSMKMDYNGNIYDKDYNEKGFMYDSKWPENGALGKIIADGWQITYPIR
jgi:type II secretory pathway pseudopilin PulG